MSFSILKQKWLLQDLRDYFLRIWIWESVFGCFLSVSQILHLATVSVARTLCFYAACSPSAGETPLPHWHPSYTSSNRTARWVWRTSQGLVGYAASLVGCSKGLKQHRKHVRWCELMELQINGYITKQILQGDEIHFKCNWGLCAKFHTKNITVIILFLLEEVNNFIPGCYNFDWKIFLQE